MLVTLRSILREMHEARLKSDFVSFITHELKTPLSSIRMFTDTLLMGRAGTDGDRRRCIELIDSEATRLAQLIHRVLQFASIERSQHRFHFESCEMSAVVDDAIKLFREHNADADVEIEVNQAQHISHIRMDRSAIIEVLLNLLSNAEKYSRGSPQRIVVNLRESIDHIAVDVVDNGIGISKRDQRRIFEKFFRAQDYLTREVEGTGLGLSFARYIARIHNGDIKVSSIVGHGSTFTLELKKDQVLAE
jgi:signal transduction histidine kinase